MTGKKALLDSNIIIYLSRNELDLDLVDQFDNLSISVITYMEILGYKFSDQSEERFICDLLSAFHMHFVDQEIAEGVIQIRKNKRIKLPDAIIASTAILNDLCLITRNVDDFSNIANLNIMNPFN